jgi:hypothetical protein
LSRKRDTEDAELYPPIELLDARAERLDDLAHAPQLVPLGLQLVDLAQHLRVPLNLLVGERDGVARGVELRLRRELRLLV